MTRGRQALAVGTAAVGVALAGLLWWKLADRGAGFVPAGPLGFTLEPSASWRHVTDAFDVQISTNSLGLRGPEVVVPKPLDRYRVLVLGDSLTFGWGVELQDAWPARMARELQATGARPLEVIVAGVPGWSLPQEFVFLEQRGLDLQPDLVLWQLCSNDLLEMERLDLELDARRLPRAVAAEPPLSAGLPEAWREAFEQLDEADRERIEAEYRAGRIDPVLSGIARSADAARRGRAGGAPEGRILELPVAEVLRGLRSGPDFGVRYVDHLVSAARARCAGCGAVLRVMLAQARPTARDAGDLDDGVAALRAWAAQQTPAVLDTGDLLPDSRADELFLPNDPHWSPVAHPLVGHAVAQWLADDYRLGLSLVPAR